MPTAQTKFTKLLARTQVFTAYVVSSVFGVGFSPIAPGTVGSAVVVVPVCLFLRDCTASVILYALLISGLVSVPAVECLLNRNKNKNLLLFTENIAAAGAPSLPRNEAAHQLKKLIDPRFIVIDEVVGQLCALLTVALYYPLTYVNVIFAFVAFRCFDIIKPPPIRNVERSLEKNPSLWSIGVVVDDIIAGFMAGGVTCGVYACYIIPK
ncbi:MAG: phosphatidylglycerophosphatase A [Holosporales bacterium]|jgi:phosphatidylglycerophosphatase A|nr:phosphatidylglycerophosphatase A [Holosporales bacterium]